MQVLSPDRWGCGHIIRWCSSANPPDPNNPDQNTYTNTANDFALYNALGGVAAGRSVSVGAENETFTGVVTPNGKLGFGTGFLIKGLATGNATFTPAMIAPDNGGDDQSLVMVM